MAGGEILMRDSGWEGKKPSKCGKRQARRELRLTGGGGIRNFRGRWETELGNLRRDEKSRHFREQSKKGRAAVKARRVSKGTEKARVVTANCADRSQEEP